MHEAATMNKIIIGIYLISSRTTVSWGPRTLEMGSGRNKGCEGNDSGAARSSGWRQPSKGARAGSWGKWGHGKERNIREDRGDSLWNSIGQTGPAPACLRIWADWPADPCSPACQQIKGESATNMILCIYMCGSCKFFAHFIGKHCRGLKVQLKMLFYPAALFPESK